MLAKITVYCSFPVSLLHIFIFWMSILPPEKQVLDKNAAGYIFKLRLLHQITLPEIISFLFFSRENNECEIMPA